jgi:deazaflavin-dependent oxidoreductase (nitroreductase family)
MRTRRPRPRLISLLSAPARLYDWRVGWLLGRRFLRLTHVGRRSGRLYRTVLEVVGENGARNEVIVVAGLGRSAQWYRNLQVHEGVEVAIAGERFAPVHRELSTTEAAAVIADYERRNRYFAPLIRRLLSWLVGWRYDGTESARHRLVAELPLIGLRPAWAVERPASSEALADRHHFREAVTPPAR